jgi:hypothetical protein
MRQAGNAARPRPSYGTSIRIAWRLVDEGARLALIFTAVPTELTVVLSLLPPWLVLAVPLGVINASAYFMLLGYRVSSLVWYAGLGALAAAAGQVIGKAVQAPAPVQIGELNVLVASASTWIVLTAARIRGL